MIVHRMEADGNCLYNSIAYGIIHGKNIENGNVKQLSKQLRHEMITFMFKKILSNDKDRLQMISSMAGTFEDEHICSNNNKFITSLKYIKDMSKNGTWGGLIELYFLNEVVKIYYGFKGIVVYDQRTNQPFIGMEQKLLKKTKKPIMNISFENDCHFNFVEILT